MLSLADYVRSQAQWRADKAEQYPDDERNKRSARKSLRELADALETTRAAQGELIGLDRAADPRAALGNTG